MKAQTTFLKLGLACISALSLTLLINSCTTPTKTVTQDSDAAIYLMTSELSQLKSSNRSRHSIPYSYREQQCSFSTQFYLEPKNQSLKKVQYRLEGDKLIRTENGEPKVFLSNVDRFKIEFFDIDEKQLATNIQHLEKPHYAKLILRFKGDHKKSFYRSVYFL